MFPFDRAPESFDEGIVGGASSAVAADAAAGGQQGLFVGEAGELAALVGIEDVWGRGVAQRVGQGLQAKAHVERVGELPAEHVARVPVEYGSQIEEALGHGHVRDIGAPHLVGGRGRAVAQQVGIGCDALARHTQARFGVDRLVAHQAHEAAHALLVDDVAGQAQVVTQAEYSLKVMVGELLVQQPHQFQVAGAFAPGLVVETAAGQAQGLTAGGHRAVGRVRRLDQGPLLGY